MALRTDYKNDELNTAVNTERQFEEVTNPNGTKSYRDVTDYSQVGDNFDADLVNSQNAEINAKAPIDSPAFTGTPTAPTQSQNTADDTIATTSYVKSAFNNFIDPNLRTFGKAADAQATGNRIASVQASVPMVDATLSIFGAAADAKAVGDAVSGIPTVDTTLTISGAAADAATTGNIRDVASKAYINIEDLKNDVVDAEVDARWVQGRVTASGGVLVEQVNTYFAHTGFIPGTSPINVTISDGYSMFVWRSQDNSFGSAYNYPSSSWMGGGTYTFQADKSYPYFIICVQKSGGVEITAEEAESAVTVLNTDQKSIFALKTTVSNVDSKFDAKTDELNYKFDNLMNDIVPEVVSGQWTQNRAKISANVIVEETSNYFVHSAFLLVKSIRVTVSEGFQIFAFKSSDDEWSSSATNISNAWSDSGQYVYGSDTTYPYIILCVKKVGTAVAITAEEVVNAITVENISTNSIFALKSTVNDLSSEVELNNTEINTKFNNLLQDIVPSSVDGQWALGRVMESSGTVVEQSNTSFAHTAFININSVSVTIPSGYHLMAWSVKDNLFGSEAVHLTGSWLEDTTETFSTDTTHPYLIMCVFKTGYPALDVNEISENIQINSLSSESIFALKSSVSELDLKVEELEEKIKTNTDGIDCEWVQNRAKAQGGVIVEEVSAYFVHSGFLKMDGAFKVSVPNGYDIMAFLSATNDFGGAYQYGTYAWTNNTTVVIPANENYPYIVFCVKNHDGTQTIVPDEAKQSIGVEPVYSEVIPLTWEFKGYIGQYGILNISSKTSLYRLSTPIKLYEGDHITFTANVTNNVAVLIKFFDRWNTYWANTIGQEKLLIFSSAKGVQTFNYDIQETGYYVLSASIDQTATLTVSRTDAQRTLVETDEKLNEFNYGIEKHNYVDIYDFVPNLQKKRINAITTYSGDNKVSTNHIVNAVAYPNGEIIACRAGGAVVKIGLDGTETTLMTISGSQDWRGMFIDSNYNVYVSPHNSMTLYSMSHLDRGVYRLPYGGTQFTKVISFCRSTTDITEWIANHEYTVGDIVFKDRESVFYRCITSHTSSSTFTDDLDNWATMPNWSAGTAYSVGNIVIFEDRFYWCNTAHTSGTEFDYSKWEAATEHLTNDDTMWTMCEDDKGALYGGVYSHSIRANPSVYKSEDGGVTWRYIHNFIMNNTYSSENYDGQVVHVHCLNFSEYDHCLYAAVGEINTISRSDDYGKTFVDLEAPSYYGQPTYVLGVKDGVVIGSDGHYSCGVSKLMTDGKTMKLCGRTAPGFIFNIRRSDLTGWLYAWTRIDNLVGYDDRCPPYEAIDDPTVLEQWKQTADYARVREWEHYNAWAEKYYPEDAIRPQNSVIMVSRDDGDTWEVLRAEKVSQNKATICGFITVGYFRDGECLSGLLRPIEGTTSGMAFVEPIIISEGKKKRTATGYDLDGEIFIKTNNSNIVSFNYE